MNTENYGVGSSITASERVCTNRLPCGVCRLMQTPCPLGVNSYPDMRWKDFNNVTCKETGNLTTTLQSLSNTEVQQRVA